MSNSVQINLHGTYRILIDKDETGEFSSIILLKKDSSGVSPVLDFPVKLIQQNSEMGMELEFQSDDVFFV